MWLYGCRQTSKHCEGCRQKCDLCNLQWGYNSFLICCHSLETSPEMESHVNGEYMFRGTLADGKDTLHPYTDPLMQIPQNSYSVLICFLPSSLQQGSKTCFGNEVKRCKWVQLCSSLAILPRRSSISIKLRTPSWEMLAS